MAHKTKGKYAKSHRKKQRNGKVIWICLAALLCCGLAVWLLWGGPTSGAYSQIVRDGYTGSQEQWLASIVGQEVQKQDEETAYELAVKNGYTGSEAVWVETVTGVKNAAAGESLYAVACRNGYAGTLAQWLTEIAENPEKLGVSEKKEAKTEYELACEYGYTGTFIEWLISVTNDRVF